MRHESLYRLGGNAVLLGAILGGVAILLHAPQPMDLAAFSALSMGPWMAAHWMFVVGTVGVAGGLASFARHFARTDGEGWSVLGLGAIIVTAALNVAIVAPEIVAFDTLRAMNADGTNVGAQHAYTAVNLNLMSLVHVAGPMFWLGVGFFALGMRKDPAWPRWLGLVGIAIAVIEIAANWTVTNFTVFRILFAIGYLWLAVAGVMFSRFAGMSAGERPGVSAPRDAYKPSAGVPVG